MATTLGKVLEEDRTAALQQQARLEGSGGKVLSVSRLLTTDSSAGAGAAPSFRVYYGVASAGAVPFLWESQPGTPKKDAASDTAMPPLTPPPSYFAAAKEDDARAGRKGGKKAGGILGSILPRLAMARRRTRPSGSPTSSFSSVSSSSSSASSTFSSFRGTTQSPAACSSMRRGGGSSSRMRAPSACSSMRGGGSSSRMHAPSSAFSDEDEAAAAVPACFGVRAESFRAIKACRVALTVRSALASVGGSGHVAANVKAN